MKDWNEVSQALSASHPLISQLLNTNGADVLGSIIARTLEVANDPDDVLDGLDTEFSFKKLDDLENSNRKKYEAMLYTEMANALKMQSEIELQEKSFAVKYYIYGISSGIALSFTWAIVNYIIN